MTTESMSFSFLTSGPVFTCEVPAGLPTVPDLSSPVLSGVGGREFAYTPNPAAQELSQGMARDGELLKILTDRDGRLVELFKRFDPPTVWWLRWELSTGVIATHLRAIDGIERADIVVNSLSITEDGPTPYLLLYPPLKRFVSLFPGYQESASVWKPDGELAIRFVRPAFLRPGKMMFASTADGFYLRAGRDEGMEVQVSARVESHGRETLALLMDTLREGA
jgi:hypothetical protein